MLLFLSETVSISQNKITIGQGNRTLKSVIPEPNVLRYKDLRYKIGQKASDESVSLENITEMCSLLSQVSKSAGLQLQSASLLQCKMKLHTPSVEGINVKHVKSKH
jgi:hypothetical protein